MRGKHPIEGAVLDQGRRRMKAKAAGAVVAVVILLIMGGLVYIHLAGEASNVNAAGHKGIYFYVESAHFVNSSGSIYFETSVKNTGSVFIDSLTIWLPSTGSTIGTLASIAVGGTVNGSFPISGVENGTLYSLDYNATSGNLTYSTIVPVGGI